MTDNLGTRAALLDGRHGFGAATLGGALGPPMIVDNANAKGSHSLRDACETGGGWITFADDFTIRTPGPIYVRPNTTVDGRGHNVTIRPQGSAIGLVYDGVKFGPRANIIVAYLNFAGADSPGPNNKAMFFGGGGAGQPGGGCDQVWLHHCDFTDFRDTPVGFGGFGGHVSGVTVSWCRFHDQPGPICWAQNITTGTAPSRDGKAIRLGGDPEDTTESGPLAGGFTLDHCLFEHCNERQPFGNGTRVHAYNNVVRKWGRPDGSNSVAQNPRRLMQLRSEANVFEPYVPGERHHFSALVGHDVFVTTPDKRAIHALAGEGTAIATAGNLLLNGAAEAVPADNDPTACFVPPYPYTLDAPVALVAVVAGAGNVA